LSNNFKLISKIEFEKLNFVPFIKFDKSNCDIDKEEKRINQILKYKNSDKAIEFVNNYIKELPKSFQNIANKPNKIYLCCFDCEKTFNLKKNL